MEVRRMISQLKKLHIQMVIFLGVWAIIAVAMVTINVYMYEFVYFMGCD